MVTVSQQQQRWQIVAEPNRSANWQTNKRLWLCLSLLGLLVAAGFSAIGAWMVIPFVGLELAALGAGLYYTSWKLSERHVLRGDCYQLIIEKGVYHPRQSWQVAAHDACISVLRDDHSPELLAIQLCAGSERVDVGDFLDARERSELLRRLRECGLVVRNDSPAVAVDF